MTSIYNLPVNFNIKNFAFHGAQTIRPQKKSVFGNGYITKPLQNDLYDQARIEAIARLNPRVMEILQENKIPLKVNTDELEKLRKGHLKDTRVVVAKIYSALPIKMKEQVNLKELQEAAMYHDFGKVLIPKAVLNKASSLSEDERKIMEQHSELGYELLKNSGLSENTLKLIKYHHQTMNKQGYPNVIGNFEFNLSAQILSIADKYSALREERCYKKAMSREEALKIIYEDVKKGNLSEEVYLTLVKATS